MNRNWSIQNPKPAFKTKTGNNQNYKTDKIQWEHTGQANVSFPKGGHLATKTELK